LAAGAPARADAHNDGKSDAENSVPIIPRTAAFLTIDLLIET